MKLDFKQCLEKGKLVKIKSDKSLVSIELKEAKSDLKSAEREIEIGNWKWVVEKAYYAMFHAARALLLLKGYKERSHQCLIIGLNDGKNKSSYLEFIRIAKFRRDMLHDIMKKLQKHM